MRMPTAERGPLVYNLNTYVLVAGFCMTIAGIFIGWGYMASEVRSGLAAHDLHIGRLDTRVTALEATARILDNHELRLSNVEKRISDSAAEMRTVGITLNDLTTDVRVVKEILQRLEASSRRPP